jgi:hypothetical protein
MSMNSEILFDQSWFSMGGLGLHKLAEGEEYMADSHP